jgi:hypothetical protein
MSRENSHEIQIAQRSKNGFFGYECGCRFCNWQSMSSDGTPELACWFERVVKVSRFDCGLATNAKADCQ